MSRMKNHLHDRPSFLIDQEVPRRLELPRERMHPLAKVALYVGAVVLLTVFAVGAVCL